MTNWLNAHLLPCPFKYLFGIDCPGCGFQRSAIALFSGNLAKSIQLYPATIPVLMAAIFLLMAHKLPLKNPKVVKKSVYITVSALIMLSYSLKLMHTYPL